MSISDVNNQSFDPLQIGLPKPKSMGDQFTSTVTRPGGEQLGEGDNALKTTARKPGETVIQDVLEEIKAAEANLPIELQGVILAFNVQSARFVAQQQIDSLDPGSPVVPLLLKFVELTYKMELNAGDLVAALGAKGAETLATQQRIALGEANAPTGAANISTAAAAAPTPAVGGNPWFAASAYVAFLTNYWEMLRTLKEMKDVDGKTQIAGMNMMVELAKDTADAIMDAAETRFWEHIAMAIVDGVSIVVTVACTVGSIVASLKTKPEGDATGGPKPQSSQQVHVYNQKWTAISMGFDAFSRASQSAEKAANNIIQGVMELKAAQYDALKEMLQAYRQMAQMQADRSLDSFKQNTDMITQLIQQIDQMRSKILEAQMKALTRSSA